MNHDDVLEGAAIELAEIICRFRDSGGCDRCMGGLVLAVAEVLLTPAAFSNLIESENTLSNH